jgi:pyruvate dehydrogenase E2 component (dihydrolipoamide acetyltransferase)
VSKGDVLFEVETDKAVLEAESFFEGTLLKVFVAEGETVPVQAVVGYIGEPGEEVPAAPPRPPEKPVADVTGVGRGTTAAVAPAAAAGVDVPSAAAPQPAAVPAAAQGQPARQRISPRARRLAREKLIDPGRVTGTGPGGRVVEKDLSAYLDDAGYDRLRISPAARAVAANEEIDILAVEGTGDAGRIVVADVRRAVAERPKPMSKIRRLTADRLTRSFMGTPHIFVTVTADMTGLLAFRKDLKEAGTDFTVTDFIMQAVVLCLGEYPEFNSSTDGTSVRWNSRVNLGLAVSMEKGLVVPVLHGAERLSMADLHDRAGELVAKARTGKLTPDEMTGGSFTISNMGMLDVENFCAIINPGEGAILAVASTVEQPVVVDGSITVRSMMKMTLSADHRLNDGAAAARFVNSIKAKLEDIELWRSLT